MGQTHTVWVSPHSMSPISSVTAARGPIWRWSTRALRYLVAGLLLVWSVLLAAWLTLYWVILPHIDEWRPRVEQLASRSLGVAVKIGSIRMRTAGWVPAAELHEVVLLDAQGREALRLPRLAAALSVPALLALEFRFEQLLIEQASLEIRRDVQGRIRVAGLELEGSLGGDSAGTADWFFRQHEFVIRGATLTWVDEQRQAPPLALTDATLVVRNGLRSHEMRVDATPPAAWGDRFSLRARLNQPLMARAGDWRRWRGTLHADLPHADVALLRQYIDLPFELREGRGALRAWVEVADGRPGAATVDLALRDVTLQLAAGAAPLGFARISARLDGEQTGGRARLSARQLSFATTDGLVWPESSLDASWRLAAPVALPGAGEPEVIAGEFSADRLDLSSMASVAARLPVGERVRKLLAELSPRGTVHDLAARWDGPLDAPRQYQVRARMKGLAIAAAPAAAGVGRPGWTHADIDLHASELGGDARLALSNGVLELPGVFDKPVVPLRRFDAQLTWRIGAQRPNGAPIELRVKEARFENDDAQGELALSWHTGDGAGHGRAGRFPGMLDLQGTLSRGAAASVARYLPTGVPRKTRDYVQAAVRSGTLSAVNLRIKGDLWDFPFHGPQAARDSEFRIAGQVKDLALAYIPSKAAGPAGESAWESPWPAIRDAEADLAFDRGGMIIRNGQGRIFGVELRGIQGGVGDFLQQPVLEIEGQGRGPLADFTRFVNATPVGQWIGGALAQAGTDGVADLRLALNLPLTQLAQSTLRGSVQLGGNEIRLAPDTPLLSSARGRIDFTHKSLQVVGASARVLGGEATFEGGTQADGSLRFSGQGSCSAEGLRKAAELGPIARIATVLQGQSTYRVQLGHSRGITELDVTSPLTGMAINLPPPLAKSAESALALHYSTTLQPEADAAAPPRDQLRIDLGSVVHALYEREHGSQGPRVLRGALGVNTAAPAPVPGGQASIEAGTLNVDAWQAALARLLPADAAGGEPGYMPRVVSLRAQELVAGARRVTRLKMDLNHWSRDGDQGWRANLDADQLAGLIEYRQPRSAASAGRVFARLSRLSLPPADADSVEQLLEQAPTSVPALDIVVDDFELRGKKLGHLEIEAVNRAGVAGDSSREWRLNRLAIRTPEAALTASGQWAAVGPAARRRMSLDFQLNLEDSGAFLERLGYGEALRGGKGSLQGQLGWSGSPLALDLRSLDGAMHLSLDEGQFLRADAGAARLLGVLSLQALPRRLMLDFRDVFEDGFAFDQVSGDVRLAAGVASTGNLRMRGLQAAVLMEGRADIARETQDLRVLVIPEINAGTASLAYAAINPALGLGTFVAQWLLRRPLIAASTREFRVTGSWADPKIEPVERSAGDAAPDVEARPAAAASAPSRTQ
jgi:uncharacterized protein (TIGR02099 family)